uniref:Uncharacterized protein n=1 Tax=Chromera velia CCMP2878 TaxID=1169474 RepID=A0A0G4I0R8_9ALVE|eukprot:Cvel_34511.t1-p1 / transcript=Cvel_34511.t1 / gene=Cvel_34511 / organism=Chromera_velia_CCMP2878 / gene_product=hypothetical protein / transcript_product=hypothetical protein / location=Cvel_scaffold5954:327-1222(-) / protein_length=188 / sequence_SO=supercontig / SO=protein_coding / is_pseudo=false
MTSTVDATLSGFMGVSEFGRDALTGRVVFLRRPVHCAVLSLGAIYNLVALFGIPSSTAFRLLSVEALCNTLSFTPIFSGDTGVRTAITLLQWCGHGYVLYNCARLSLFQSQAETKTGPKLSLPKEETYKGRPAAGTLETGVLVFVLASLTGRLILQSLGDKIGMSVWGEAVVLSVVDLLVERLDWTRA